MNSFSTKKKVILLVNIPKKSQKQVLVLAISTLVTAARKKAIKNTKKVKNNKNGKNGENNKNNKNGKYLE